MASPELPGRSQPSAPTVRRVAAGVDPYAETGAASGLAGGAPGMDRATYDVDRRIPETVHFPATTGGRRPTSVGVRLLLLGFVFLLAAGLSALVVIAGLGLIR